MLYNRRINEELRVVKKIVKDAVDEAKVPGPQQSLGNASGTFPVIQTEMLPYTGPTTIDAHNGQSGTDADGNEFWPFLLDVDSMDTPGPYLA
jgi:hypothetical protein